MKFNYTLISTGEILDVVTLTAKGATYKTGQAKDMVGKVLAQPGGMVVAKARFKSWSNGYVSTSEIAD